jgi:hypothetical protein
MPIVSLCSCGLLCIILSLDIYGRRIIIIATTIAIATITIAQAVT